MKITVRIDNIVASMEIGSNQAWELLIRRLFKEVLVTWNLMYDNCDKIKPKQIDIINEECLNK